MDEPKDLWKLRHTETGGIATLFHGEAKKAAMNIPPDFPECIPVFFPSAEAARQFAKDREHCYKDYAPVRAVREDYDYYALYNAGGLDFFSSQRATEWAACAEATRQFFREQLGEENDDSAVSQAVQIIARMSNRKRG